MSESELKFVLPQYRAGKILDWLEHTCLADPSYPQAVVSSIYYDSLRWNAVSEKVNSTYLKTKVRLRWYEDTANSDVSFAEVKYKTGNRRFKERIETPWKGAWLASVPLDDPVLMDIPRLLCAHSISLEQSVFPAFLIRYRRYRFLEPISDTRISLDVEITVPQVNSQRLPMSNPAVLGTAVCEIKGALFELPQNLSPLLLMGCQQASFSKYLAAYQALSA